ncbi:MAG: TraR/DksA C4-type zinc finger protein [Candidatus Goldbacteria bacterium]|nr:TraR/DksA C4-type zinc finger protein [Candidatus Goldiibacteriota bacterium]
MEAKKLESFRKKLIEMRNEILKGIIEDNQELIGLKEESGQISEEYDMASTLLETEMKEQLEENDLNMLKEINEALNRINSGTYGKCSECGEEISEDRLDFLPFTNKCEKCAKKR